MDDGSICNSLDQLADEVELSNKSLKEIRRELKRQSKILSKILELMIVDRESRERN